MVSCVAAAGVVGWLAGCPTVDLGATPADIGQCMPDRLYFETDIWPGYIERTDAPMQSCIAQSGCHNDALGARSGLRLTTAAPVDFSANYRAVTRFLNCGDPSSSALVLRPRRIGGHPVTVFASASDPAITDVFLPWFDL
jgi:hypothetical protein